MPIVKNEILLFKSSVEDESRKDDPYVATLRQAMFTVKVIPVMDFVYTRLKTLQTHLLNPDLYSGMIFTSPRAVTAAKLSLESACLPQRWSDLPVFVVGEGTARTLMEELSLNSEGSLAGNASALADYILQNSYKKPLLFPCAKMKHDILPTKLEEGGIKLEIVTVYESIPHPDLKENINRVIEHGRCLPEFLVYFSPSGVKFTLPILRSLKVPVNEMKLVAIGPTTKGYLQESQLPVWSSAVKPSPQCLLEAILHQ